MRVFFPVVSVVLCLMLSGCALLRPYHMQIEQGIALKPEQVSQLKVGMTKDQATYILGTPNLIDPYHPDTWYYIYTNKENYSPITNNQLIVDFNKNDRVAKIRERKNVPTK